MSNKFKKKGTLVKTIAVATSGKRNYEEDQITDEELQEAFDCLDSSGDGLLCVDELEKGMRCLGMNPTREEILEMIDSVDKDDDRNLNFEEFKKAMKSKGRQSIEVQRRCLREAFEVFDEDGSGFLERDEFRRCMGEYGEGLSEEEIEDMMADMNPNDDGKISVEEFVDMFCQHARLTGNGEKSEEQEAY